MDSVYCRGCGQQIHSTAPTCPHCGATQSFGGVTTASPDSGTPWMAWTAVAFSAISATALFADETWGRDEYVGGCLFALIGLILAGISLAQRRSGKAPAIVALICGGIGLLLSAGHLN